MQKNIGSSRGERPSGLHVFFIIFTLLAANIFSGCQSDAGPEVWVIGLDAADWDQLDPMIARGELPHLASLKHGGASGILRSEKPLISPVLWNTIATGKSPDEHGVTWFMTNLPDGSKTPVSSNQRKTRTFWNIASEAGLKSGVIGWWATWPADPLNGFLVSDYVGWHSFGVSGQDANDDGKTWPPELMSNVRNLMPSPAAITSQQIGELINLPTAKLAYNPNADIFSDSISHLRQAMATSRGYTNVALAQLADDRPALLSVYYEGTDAITHLFGDFQPPKQAWIEKEDYKAFHQVVDQYWRWQDELLGELLAKRGPQTTIIVVSDHGFRVGSQRRKEDAFHVETADADHMFDGVVIINGPDIVAGSSLDEASLYDVTPTVLYALDLAVATDMKGRVLSEAWTDGAIRQNPIRSRLTYETSPLLRRDAVAQPADATAQLEDMLRSLGYLSGSNTSATETAPEETINLATVLMQQGRHQDAVAQLRTVVQDNPDLFLAQLVLAQALWRVGSPASVAEAESLSHQLMAAHPERLEVHEDLATGLNHHGRQNEALAIYEAGLKTHPDWTTGLVGIGRALVGLDRKPEAKKALQAALAMDPRHAGAHQVYGKLLWQAGAAGPAMEHLAAAHQLQPENPSTALLYANYLQQSGRHEQALSAVQNSLNNLGPQADLLAEKGAILMRLGETKTAIESMKKSAELDRNNVLNLGNLGMAYAMRGDLTAAVGAFEGLVALQPDMAAGHAQLGSLYAQIGEIKQAESELKTAVEYDPSDPSFLVGLARLLVAENQFEEARIALNKAIALAPNSASAVYQLSELEVKAGNLEKGRSLNAKAQLLHRQSQQTP
ncbi:MAG: tetratricopeptide (TPR) repeat protein [Candidatus Krumholzibacteriia bacterium]|jgi:tetratricopeptide (TPR) repeat protein